MVTPSSFGRQLRSEYFSHSCWACRYRSTLCPSVCHVRPPRESCRRPSDSPWEQGWPQIDAGGRPRFIYVSPLALHGAAPRGVDAPAGRRRSNFPKKRDRSSTSSSRSPSSHFARLGFAFSGSLQFAPFCVCQPALSSFSSHLRDTIPPQRERPFATGTFHHRLPSVGFLAWLRTRTTNSNERLRT